MSLLYRTVSSLHSSKVATEHQSATPSAMYYSRSHHSQPASSAAIAAPTLRPAVQSSALRPSAYAADVYAAPPLRRAADTVNSNNVTPVKRKPLSDTTFITQVSRTPSQTAQCAAAGQSATPSKSTLPPGRTPTLCAASLIRNHPLMHSRPMLVLDLDETLVHASVEASDGMHDVAFVVEMGGQRINVFVKIRPFAKEFLRRAAQMFEVCVFTASLAPYADRVVDYLDPAGQLVHHRLYREHCTNVDGNYVKDMNLMGRSLERVAIVDNSPIAYSFHPENAIPIESWFDDRNDRALVDLMPLLEHFAQTCDFFRTRRKFRIATGDL